MLMKAGGPLAKVAHIPHGTWFLPIMAEEAERAALTRSRFTPAPYKMLTSF
jgi:hypothetical protein